MMPRVRRGLITLLVLAAVGLVVIAGRLGKSRHDKSPAEPGRRDRVRRAKARAAPPCSKPKQEVKVKAHGGAGFAVLLARRVRGVPDRAPACGAARARASARWNVRWFPLGTKDGSKADRMTDVPWLACTIADDGCRRARGAGVPVERGGPHRDAGPDRAPRQADQGQLARRARRVSGQRSPARRLPVRREAA